MMEKRFSEEYRNKHWRKCRFGVDPRSCGCAVLRSVVCALVTRPDSVMLPCQPFTGPDNPYLVFCKKDGNSCNASWKE